MAQIVMETERMILKVTGKVKMEMMKVDVMAMDSQNYNNRTHVSSLTNREHTDSESTHVNAKPNQPWIYNILTWGFSLAA